MSFFKKLKALFSVKDLMFTALIFVIILTLAFCKGENLMDVTFGDEAVDVITAKYTLNIPYDMVDRIEIQTYSEDDERMGGKTDITLRTGLWKNEVWGEYYSCIDLQTDTCIVVHLNDGRTFVFSHRSDEQVAEDFETFQSHLDALKN